MELKDYQHNTLETFVRWWNKLEEASQDSLKKKELYKREGLTISDDICNYPKTAWQQLAGSGVLPKSAREYIDRTDGTGNPIPHLCFKVPTGGGKTLLAAAALERLNRQNGLTLWITPTRAIYKQTKVALWNKEHPYRQMLECASGGRVKLLEKDDIFTSSDIDNYLCVMLLMLPATNRQKGKEFLKMFRNSGRYPTFFPDSDDALGDRRLLNNYKDLETTKKGGLVKHSLFNVFKMLRPVVVLDEAHKAYGVKKKGSNEQFVRSINRLNPSLVIELSATPNRGISNLLVDITGIELQKEEMIKLPVRVTSFTNTEWQYTLGQAYEQLEKLDAEAKSLHSAEGRYIRPIAVVRVERTGKDQRDGERVHAEDVREYLIRNLGVRPEAVRVKSSDKDELGQENLLSEFSSVRWIITKAALMEGWDCSFAYLLVMLDNTRAQNAITQLVGRVIRQPYAQITKRELLNQCYVYCWNTDVGQAVENVKNGLEREGLTGIGDNVFSSQEKDYTTVTLKRRKEFREKEIFLPLVLHKDGADWIKLDYQRHILSGIDWASIEIPPDFGNVRTNEAKEQSGVVGLNDSQIAYHPPRELDIDKTVKISWFVRRLSEIVPNPWQAARIVGQMVQQLRDEDKTDEDIHDLRTNLAFKLQERVSKMAEEKAEKLFRDKLRKGEIRFDLEAGHLNFKMRESYKIQVSENSQKKYKKSMQLNLFEEVYEDQFDSGLERDFAFYLDDEKALGWWHRVAVRQRGDYYLQGWRQGRIYPDFVAMKSTQAKGKYDLFVFETKGEHLRGNPDTDYKERVLNTLQEAFNNYGTMTVSNKGKFELVFENDLKTEDLLEISQD